jgi:hypothetical protein
MTLLMNRTVSDITCDLDHQWHYLLLGPSVALLITRTISDFAYD